MGTSPLQIDRKKLFMMGTSLLEIDRKMLLMIAVAGVSAAVTAFPRLLILSAVSLLAAHIWSLEIVRQLRLALIDLLRVGSQKDSEVNSTHTERIMAKARERLGTHLLDVLALSCSLILITSLTVLSRVEVFRFWRYHVAVTIGFVVCFYLHITNSKVTSKLVYRISFLVHVYVAIRVCHLPLDFLALTNACRSLVRLLAGLACLDVHRVLLWNLAVSALTMIRIWIWNHQGGTQWLSSEMTNECLSLSLTLTEVFTVMTVIFLVSTVRTVIISMATMGMQASDASLSLNAARRLLSVMSDAEMQLGPKLEIINPSTKLSRFLGTDPQLLAGMSLDTFISPHERQRMYEFLTKRTADIHDETEQEAVTVREVPRSFNVTLRLASGQDFNARLYHTRLPSQDPDEADSHLMCFCDDEELNLPRDHQLVVEDAEESVSESSEMAKWRELQTRALDYQSEKENDRSSSASSLSNHQVAVPWLDAESIQSLSISCDPFGRKHDIHQLVISFRKHNKALKPQLLDWVSADAKGDFRRWLEKSVSCSIKEVEPPVLAGSLNLSLPFVPKGIILMAAGVDLYLEEPEDGSGVWASLELSDMKMCLEVRPRQARSMTGSGRSLDLSPSQLDMISED